MLTPRSRDLEAEPGAVVIRLTGFPSDVAMTMKRLESTGATVTTICEDFKPLSGRQIIRLVRLELFAMKA